MVHRDDETKAPKATVLRFSARPRRGELPEARVGKDNSDNGAARVLEFPEKQPARPIRKAMAHSLEAAIRKSEELDARCAAWAREYRAGCPGIHPDYVSMYVAVKLLKAGVAPGDMMDREDRRSCQALLESLRAEAPPPGRNGE